MQALQEMQGLHYGEPLGGLKFHGFITFFITILSWILSWKKKKMLTTGC